MKYFLGLLCVALIGCQKKGCEDRYLNDVRVGKEYTIIKGLYTGCTFKPYVRVAGPYFEGEMVCLVETSNVVSNISVKPISVDFREVFTECAE